MTDFLASVLNRTRKLGSLADQVLVSGGNFLTIAICAHSLSLSEQGKFTYIFASYMALLLLNVAGIFQGAAVRAPAQDSTYQSSLAKLQVLQALLLSFLVASAWLGLGGVFGWKATITEAALLFAFLAVQQLADFDRRAAYIFSGTRRALCSSAALYPLRLIGLLVINPETVTQVLWMLVLSALMPAIPACIAAGRYKSADSWSNRAKEHLMYSRLFIMGAPLAWLWSYIPIFLLGTMHGKEQAALLASIRGISNIANVLMEQLETKVVADWARIRHGGEERHMKSATIKLLRVGVTFWVCGLLLTVLLGKKIVTLVLGNLYADHWNLLVIGWLAYGAYFLARVSGIRQRAMGLAHVEFTGNLSGVLAAVVGGLALIPAYGASGAGWVFVIISIAILSSQQLVVMRRDQSSISDREH